MKATTWHTENGGRVRIRSAALAHQRTLSVIKDCFRYSYGERRVTVTSPHRWEMEGITGDYRVTVEKDEPGKSTAVINDELLLSRGGRLVSTVDVVRAIRDAEYGYW